MYYHSFSVLSPIQCFIPISAFYPYFSVLSPFQRFIPISAFYPYFSVLSPFQRFILISAFYPHFSFRFQFPFQPFSFSVLSRPALLHATCLATTLFYELESGAFARTFIGGRGGGDEYSYFGVMPD